MKITIAYWTKPNGKVSINSQRITEVITGDNAKDCMQQIEQKKENHDCWKYSAIEIINVEDK